MCILCCFDSGSGIIYFLACLPACLRMIFIHFKPTYSSYLQTVTKCRSTSLQLPKPTILDRIKWNSKPPSPQIKDEAQRKGKRVIFLSLIFFFGGGEGLNSPSFSSKTVVFFRNIRIKCRTISSRRSCSFYIAIMSFLKRKTNLIGGYTITSLTGIVRKTRQPELSYRDCFF